MKTLSISQIQRELHHISDFDIIEIVDKKRDTVKGYFLDLKYKSIVYEILKKEKENSLQEFAGMWEDRDIEQKDLRSEAWKQ